MKRMWSKNELKNIADVQAKAVKKDIATLVDADGHDRFIEGDITIEEIEGFTQTYGKWSLSGSHLMFVVACDIANTTAIIGSSLLVRGLELPQFIMDKLIPTFNKVVDYKTVYLWSDDWSTQTQGFSLQKNDNKIDITMIQNLTMTKARSFRISFDLLIDND